MYTCSKGFLNYAIVTFWYEFLSIPWWNSFNTKQYIEMLIACLGWDRWDGDEPTKDRWQGKLMMKYMIYIYIWSNSRRIYCTHNICLITQMYIYFHYLLLQTQPVSHPHELKIATIHPSTLAQACLLPDELLWQIPSGKRGASRMAISPTSLDGAVNNATWGFIRVLKSSLYGNPYARVFFSKFLIRKFILGNQHLRDPHIYIEREIFIYKYIHK